jgi:hypothetical protein
MAANASLPTLVHFLANAGKYMGKLNINQKFGWLNIC